MKVVDLGDLHEKIDISYTLYLDEKGNVNDGEWSQTKNLCGFDFVWFGAGQGTDQKSFDKNISSNKYLDFASVRQLVNISAGRMCHQLF